MKNLKFIITYNGTAYNGYQSQPNGNTIQDNLEKCLKLLLNQAVSVNGCSRTDAGVHAREYVFNVKYDETLSGIGIQGIVKGMNALLPDDIAVVSCEEVGEAFHARFDSKGKEYLYLLDNSRERCVFTKDLALPYFYRIDMERMRTAAELIKGEHDFAAFCKAEAKAHLKTTVRTVFDVKIEREDRFVRIYVSGSGFLHNMVRIIAGTLIYVNEGKRNIDDVREALDGGNREKAGITLPACGLYLNRVFY